MYRRVRHKRSPWQATGNYKLKLAQLYRQFGRFEQAAALLQRFIKSRPRDPNALTALADIYKIQKNYQSAVDLYQRAAELDPPFGRGLFLGLADIYAWSGKYDQAVSLYRQALAIDPKQKDVRIQLARALSWRGDLKEAINQYQKALEGVK